MSRVLPLAFLTMLLASLGFVAPSSGATFDVSVCKSPTGTVFGTTGWTAITPAAEFQYDLSCEDGKFGVSGGPLRSELPQGFKTGWQLALPKPMTLDSFKVEEASSVTAWSGWSGQIWGRLHDQPQWLAVTSCDGENCTMPLTQFPGYNSGAIAFGVACTYKPCSAGSYAAMHVSQLVLTVNDPGSPQIESSDGNVEPGRTVSGLVSINFRATDAESGVHNAYLEVDGRVVASQSFDTPTGSCREPFTRFDPCPHVATGTLAFDTSRLFDGPHTVRLLVNDATNAHPAIAGPWTITSDNSRVENLCQAPLGAGGRARLLRRTVRFGRGTSMMLSWPGMPWTAAQAVVLVGREHLVRASVAVRRTATRFVADIPRGPNRMFRIGVREAGTTGPFVCSRAQALAVRAGPTLTATPRHLSNGDRVRLRGRLRGVAARSRTVVLQARARGGRRNWVPVALKRTRKHGRFAFSYRFERTFQPTDYLFRVRVPAQRGFPYAAGYSSRRTVYVDP